MTDWDSFEAGIEYEATGELIEDNVEAKHLPKHTDGSNVALRSEETTLCWTEDLGANIINLDGYLHPDWAYGSREIEIGDDRIFIPDEFEAKLVLPKDELVEAAEKRAAEDGMKTSGMAYVLGGWVCQARGADHISDSSALQMERVFKSVMEDDYYKTPDDATTEVYHGGRK